MCSVYGFQQWAYLLMCYILYISKNSNIEIKSKKNNFKMIDACQNMGWSRYRLNIEQYRPFINEV